MNMPLDIKMPDGSNFNPTGQARTIAVVANELEAAVNAASKADELRAELEALLGKRKRAPRKGKE
jgi:hypothetical protein